MIVEASDGSNIHKVSTFVKKKCISNMLENGAIDNLVLVSAFEFVKKINKVEQYHLILCIFIIFFAWKQLFVIYGILMYFI